jgi:hypothetical protein
MGDGSGSSQINPSHLNDNALQHMVYRNTNSAQDKEWSGDSLIPIRVHPKI